MTTCSSTWTTAGDMVWTSWCDSTSSTDCSVTTSNADVWGTWVVYSGTSTSATDFSGVVRATRPETEEERQAREDRRREREQEDRRRKIQEVIARRKAKSLLRGCLTATQRLQLKSTGGFVVRGQSGRHYRIERGVAGNVKELDEQGCPIAKLCAHMDHGIPAEDHMLVQKLMLETCEDKFLRTANRTRYHSEQSYLEPVAA